MVFHPLLKLIKQELDQQISKDDSHNQKSPSLKEYFDKNQLRDFIKSSPIDSDLYFAIVDHSKEFLLETGGKHIKKLLHNKEKGIQNQREAVRQLVDSSHDEEVSEIQSKNHLHYFAVAFRQRDTFLGALAVGGFFIRDGRTDEQRRKDWCTNAGGSFHKTAEILQQVPAFDSEYVGKLKQYFLALSQLLNRQTETSESSWSHTSTSQFPENTLESVVLKYAPVVNSSSDAIFITDHQLNSLFFNNSLKKMVRKNLEIKEELPPLKSIFSKNSHKRLTEKVKDQMLLADDIHTPEAFDMDVEFSEKQSKPASSPSLKAQLILNKAGEVKGLFGVISYREKSQIHSLEQLASQRDLYRSLFHSSPLGIFYYDNEGTILDCNRKFVEILGSRREALIGMNMFKTLYNKQLLEEIKKSLNQKQGYYEGEYKAVTGTRKSHIRGVFKGLPTEDTLSYRGMGIIEDVTEFHRTQVQFKNLLSNLPGMSYRCKNTPGWPMVFLSEGVKKLTGYQPHELQTKIEFGDLILEEDRPYVWDEVQKHIKAEDAFEITYRIKTRSGNVRWVWERGRMAEEINGEVFLEGIVSDISNLKETEFALRKSENRFRTLSRIAPVGIFTTNLEGYCHYVNDRMTDIIGVPEEKLLKLSWMNFLHHDDIDSVNAAWQESIHNKSNFKLRYRFLRPDGETRWVQGEAQPIYDQSDQITGYVGTIIDITDTINYEHQLKEQGKRYRSMFFSNKSVMLLVDPENGNIIDANKAAAEFYGYPKEQLSEMNLGDLNQEESEKSRLKHLKEALRDERTYFQFRHQLADGSARDVEAYSSTINFDDKTLVFTVVHDITDRLKTERELIKAKEKAEESDRLKSAFLATMSHELRTPLNSIIGFSDLIKNGEDPEEAERFAEQINYNGIRLLDIIEDIFEMSRIESGGMQIKESVFRLEELLNDIEEEAVTLAGNYKKSNLKINIDKSDTISNELHLKTDYTKIYQVLVNLIKNALRFTEEGQVKIGVSIARKDVVIYIEDTGIGIPRSKQQLIFERFRQADDSNTRRYGGTGLGLSISKEIIDVLGGEIWVDSKPGKGSRFTLRIPGIVNRSNKKKDSGSPAKAGNQYNWKGKTILMAEDEESNQILISEILKKTGAQLHTVENGKQLMEWLKANNAPNLILMDIKMPEVDGVEATGFVKKHYPQLPVIAMTALALPEEEQKIRKAGCDEYVKKPLKSRELKAIINNYL